jgi:hypothetical protein
MSLTTNSKRRWEPGSAVVRPLLNATEHDELGRCQLDRAKGVADRDVGVGTPPQALVEVLCVTSGTGIVTTSSFISIVPGIGVWEVPVSLLLILTSFGHMCRHKHVTSVDSSPPLGSPGVGRGVGQI